MLIVTQRHCFIKISFLVFLSAAIVAGHGQNQTSQGRMVWQVETGG